MSLADSSAAGVDQSPKQIVEKNWKPITPSCPNLLLGGWAAAAVPHVTKNTQEPFMAPSKVATRFNKDRNVCNAPLLVKWEVLLVSFAHTNMCSWCLLSVLLCSFKVPSTSHLHFGYGSSFLSPAVLFGLHSCKSRKCPAFFVVGISRELRWWCLLCLCFFPEKLLSEKVICRLCTFVWTRKVLWKSSNFPCRYFYMCVGKVLTSINIVAHQKFSPCPQLCGIVKYYFVFSFVNVWFVCSLARR